MPQIMGYWGVHPQCVGEARGGLPGLHFTPPHTAVYPDPSISGRFTGGNPGLFTAPSGGYLPARGACQGGYGLPPIGLARENREWPRYLESEI